MFIVLLKIVCVYYFRSSEDLSPVFVDRPPFYERSTRGNGGTGVSGAVGSSSGVAASNISEPTDQYRRPNNYHGTGSTVGGASSANVSGNISNASVVGNVSDGRSRARDRLYRNGPYTSVIDR